MVAVKGKLNSFNKNRVMEETGTSKNVGVRNFKVYAENDKIKPRGRNSVTELKRKSVPVNNGISQVTATDSKIRGGLKNLEGTKGKHGNSAINIGRKVLADISNIRADASSTVLHDNAKPVNTKSKSIMYSQWTSIGTGIRIASSSSSSNPLMGKLKANLSQSTGDHHTLKKVDKNDLKVSSVYIGTKVLGRKSFNTVGRKSEIPLPPTRNSLPVLKRVNKVGSSDVEKEHAENPAKSKEKCGFSVKLKVGRRVLPPGSSSGTGINLSRNKVSDGFVKMALGGQRKVDTWASSRKLLKPSSKGLALEPTVKPKVTISDTQTTSKSETIGVATLSKRKEEVQTSLLFAHKASLIPCEQPAQEELPSDCSSNLVTIGSDIIARRKSERRKSYTSLLMARSKLLKEHGEITKQDFLPNIYDDCNPLEVAEYVDEIYRYYWVMEAHHQPLKNYMEMQKEITPQMRGILVNWLIEVHLKFDLMQETLYLMVTLLDQYLSLVSIKKNEMQLVGLTALLLASKYEDFWHPRVTDLISISAESYTKDQMLGMESAILRKLKFRLNAPTPYVFMLRFLRAAQSDSKFEHLAFYLIELSLVEYEVLNFKPSLLCASAIYLARCTLDMTPAWTPLLGKHAHYEESQIRDCADIILRFHKAAGPGMLKVTYEKFLRPDCSRVAAIKPLERLPL